jgi:hypothetical protein
MILETRRGLEETTDASDVSHMEDAILSLCRSCDFHSHQNQSHSTPTAMSLSL